METIHTLKLQRLEISNFKKISHLIAEPNGHHLWLFGENTAGKSSVIDALVAATGNKDLRELPEPIRHGELKATVRCDFGEYILTRTWNRGASGKVSTRLSLTTADGQVVRDAPDMIKGWLAEFAMSPQSFQSLRDQDKIDVVLSINEVKPPVDKVREITGEEHPPRGDESAYAYLMRLSADESGLYYTRRRECGRTLTQKKAALEESQLELQQLGTAPGATGESMAKMLADMTELEGKAEEWRAKQDDAKDAAKDVETAQKKMETLEEETITTQADADRIARQISELKKQLQVKDDHIQKLRVRIENGGAVVQELIIAADEARGAANAIPDPSPQIAAIRSKIATAEQNTKAAARYSAAVQTVERLATEHAAVEKEHGRLETVLDKLRYEREHLLDGKDVGVKGLRIGNGELRLNGVSFKQASTAEQNAVACGIIFAQNPKIKLLPLDNAEHMDLHSTQEFLKLATERGWQCMLGKVVKRGPLKIRVRIVDADDEEPDSETEEQPMEVGNGKAK